MTSVIAVIALTVSIISSQGCLSCGSSDEAEVEPIDEEAMVEEYGVCERERYVGSRYLNKWLQRGYVLQQEQVVVGGSKRIHLTTKVPCDPYGEPLPVRDGEYGG